MSELLCYYGQAAGDGQDLGRVEVFQVPRKKGSLLDPCSITVFTKYVPSALTFQELF